MEMVNCDCCGPQEAVKMVRPVADPEQAAKMLLEEAYKRESSDNITCLVVRFISGPSSSSSSSTG
jgi:protein phosphatase 1L